MRLGKLLAQTLAITLFAGTHLAAAPTPSHSSPATPDAYLVDIFAAPKVDEAEVETSSPHEEDPSIDLKPPVEDPSPATDEPSTPAPNLEQAPPDRSLVLPDQPAESSNSTQPTGDPAPTPSEMPLEAPEPPTPLESTKAPEPSIAPASLLGDVIVSNAASVDYDIISAPLSTEQFHVAAVTWTGSAPLSVEIRTESRGIWGEWYALETEIDPQGNVSGTEPYIAGGSSGIQVRAALGAEPSTFELVLLTGAGTDGTVQDSDAEVAEAKPAEDSNEEQATNASTATTESLTTPAVFNGEADTPAISQSIHRTMTKRDVPAPTIMRRAAWGAPERASWRPSTSALQGAVIHHTAGNNYYTRAQSPAIVRSIWNYHTNTRGWGDIGYNFLVDRYGTIYEGREGSLAAAPGRMSIGAHAAPANTGTVGISVMGTYTAINPEQIVLTRIADIIAWRFGTAGLDPTGTWQHIPRTGASPVTLNRVIGHLEVANTACPARIMNYLPSIRRSANQKIIDSDHVKAIEAFGTIKADLEYVTINTVAIKSEADPHSRILRTLASGEMVITSTTSVRNSYGNWWKVKQGTAMGWVRNSDLIALSRHPKTKLNGSTVSHWASSYTYTYDSATAKGDRLGSIPKGGYAKPTGRVFGRYSQVTFKNRNVWVLTDRLSPRYVAPEYGALRPDLTYASTGIITLRSNPFDMSAAKRRATSGVMVLSSSRSASDGSKIWWEVRVAGVSGWVPASQLIPAEEHALSGTTPMNIPHQTRINTVLFETASSSGLQLVPLPRKTTVQTTGFSYGEYMQVVYENSVGWVRVRALIAQ